MKKKGRFFFSVVCILAIMLIIFSFSSQSGTGSSELSIKVTRVICRIIFTNYENMTGEQQIFIVNELNYFVRKLAHFSIYMLLGMFSYAAILPYKDELKKPASIALIFCAAYAVSDEIHQRFTPGRSMKVTDMLIDTFGSFVGIIIVSVIIILFNHIKTTLQASN